MVDIHKEALKRFDGCVSASQDERSMALEDRRFYSIAGAQWEGVFGEQFANRPMLEVDKVHLSIIRIFNEYRNNRISAQFVSKSGDEGDDMADLCAGLYRADQQDSVAEEAYGNAFEEAVSGGYGAWRLCAEYEDEYDEDNDYQRIRFEPIPDADSCVYFGPANRQDKSDAKFCFVLTGMAEEAYKDEYDDDPASWDRANIGNDFDWFGDDLVYVAEYYVVEEAKEKVHTFKTISGEFQKYAEKQIDDDKLRELTEIGTVLVSTKTVKRLKIRKNILSGGGVLEDCGHIAGREIPVVPVYGKRWFIDGRERFCGHVRKAKDPQRLYNMQLSTLAEEAAEGGDRTPIVAPEQMAGHQMDWAERTVKKKPFLMLNPITNADGSQTPMGPLGYTESADIPQAMAALLQISNQDIQDILGRQEQGEEIQSNISGKAVELVQSRLDMQTYIYISNFAKAERRSAQIWLSMARELYADEDRRMKILDEQDTVDFLDMSETVIGDSGEPERVVDMRRANFDVTTTIGPTSNTKRNATVRELTNLLGYVKDPVDNKVFTAAIIRNMDGEGLSQLREYYRKQLVQMGVEEPTEEDEKDAADAAENAQQQAPDPNVIYLQSEAEKNKAQAMKYQADAQRAVSETEKTEAETVETLAGIDQENRRIAIEAIREATGSGTATPSSGETQGDRAP